MKLQHLIICGVSGVAAALMGSAGCSATQQGDEIGQGGQGGSSQGGGTASSSGGGQGGSGGMTLTTSSGGGQGGAGGVPINPCDSQCGDTELCDAQNVGLDDDCDGQVDEGCSCVSGMAQACFKGDPSYLDTPGCYPGTQKCTELGTWGPCLGGVHAWQPDFCFNADQSGCHPISSVPFVTVDLKDGTGSFSADAVTESWTVSCPQGVNPCPGVGGTNPQDDFQPLQSGEYTVTYDKTTANGPGQCTYPLFVGAPGLRVELEWEHNLGGNGVDLDLHVHKPDDYAPWGADHGTAEDCAWDNCTAFYYSLNMGPVWFNGTAPPAPMDWYLDPVLEKNTCYFGPKGIGQEWQNIGKGCHNPRLDIDNITCDPTSTDPNDFDFCTPENINIDFPPIDQWTRIGVHYYSSHSLNYDVHPTVKIFCHGKLAAELGPQGYSDPPAPITFTPADSSTRFWLVADVLFQSDECSDQLCVVEPIYSDPNIKSPILTDVSLVQQSVGPAYPPVPQ